MLAVTYALLKTPSLQPLLKHTHDKNPYSIMAITAGSAKAKPTLTEPAPPVGGGLGVPEGGGTQVEPGGFVTLVQVLLGQG